MPIPILLAGLGAVAGIVGASGHLSARETNEKAEQIAKKAELIYNDAKYSLEQEQNRTEKSLLKLGYCKKHVLDSSMKQFLTSYKRIKDIQFTESVGLDEISKFTIEQQDIVEIKEMTDIYSSAISSGATGAAAGAIIALAASGSLPIVTGGLATAGSALALGEVSAAAGIAGSALSFGAAMTPLAAIAAPVVFFTGISASIKADENLEKANTMYAQSKAAASKMEISEELCKAITKRSEMFDELLVDLNGMFSECSELLAGVIKKKDGLILKKKLKREDFTKEEQELIMVTRSLAAAVKAVIDTPILSKDGNISDKAMNMYEQSSEALPGFKEKVKVIEYTDYNAKPVKIKTEINKKNKILNYSKTGSNNVEMPCWIYKIFAVVLGCVLIKMFAGSLALKITTKGTKFLFLDAFIANKIALILLIPSSVMMLCGKIEQKSMIEKICKLCYKVAISILYVQYCRTVETMKHYVIFSCMLLLLICILNAFFESEKRKLKSHTYFAELFLHIGVCVMLFLFYSFFSKVIGFSKNMCLIITSILMFCSVFDGIADN